jgi:hypothetical protein
MMVDGQAYLFASTHYDGTLTNWAISQSGLTLVGTTAYRGGLQAGGASSIMQVNVGGVASVLTGGATASGALQTHEITASGAFTGRNVLGAAASPLANLIHGETVTLSNGTQVVYGGIAGADGIGRLNFDAQGNVQSSAITLDTANVFAASVSAVTAIKCR